MTKPYTEQNFEEHIEEHLLNNGYISISNSLYDKESCIIPSELETFIKATQPKEWEKLQRHYGSDILPKLIFRLNKEVATKGVLTVLRKGIKDRDASIKLAYFKPSSGMNPEHQKLYEQNRLGVTRQLHYSSKNENSLDMVISINGLPIITMELKNSLTGQLVENAKKQYKQDRDPREPLFKFKRCLAHFALGNEKAFMTTKLNGDKTKFLPFNKDTENPVNLNGHKTAYLWEDILNKDNLLSLIQNYNHIQKVSEKYYDPETNSVKEKTFDVLIFPRYHQLDVVRDALRYVKKEGVGSNYLVQHSAGSGKSNSIAWLSHQLASFYKSPQDQSRLFDSIIVITDRRILDRQLQNTIKQFEQTQGVVVPIDINSQQLRESLEKGKDIIISTIQKFSVIAEEMVKLKGKKFAVIIDEAHSSQSGESAKDLKKVLSMDETEDGEEQDVEERILKEIEYRGRQTHISYFAFTATPKNKTLELFGRKNPDENSDRKFIAHHVYSMRQAIEEGFILDVLENYTTYKRLFKLIKKTEDDKELEKNKALRKIMEYVDIHPHEIELKSNIMLEHYLTSSVNQIQGKARAMVVSRSRLHAVKYMLMFSKLMKEKNLSFKPLVAFSGTVKDPDTNIEYTENSMNQLPPKVKIEDAYKTPEYRILIVASKYQTGFDEPLLHTMYVDRKLGGVQAVQTLSRLNRTAQGKQGTLVVDFVNELDDIRKAFQDYYQTTFLEEETDPNKLHDLHAALIEYEIFTEEDIQNFAEIFFNPKEPNEKLQPVLDKVVASFKYIEDENKREEFRSVMQSFIRMYGYISQIINWQDAALEKLYVFARSLNRKLPKAQRKFDWKVQDSVDLDSFRIQKTYDQVRIKLEKEDAGKPGITAGERIITEEEKDFLSNIIKTLNETYGLDLTEDDKIDMAKVRQKVEAHPELRAVLNPQNSKENVRYKFNQVLDELLLDFVNTKLDLYKKLTDPKINMLIKNKWFESIYASQ